MSAQHGKRRVLVESDGWIDRPSWTVLVQDHHGDGSTFWSAGTYHNKDQARRRAQRCRRILKLGAEPRAVLGVGRA